MMSSRTTAELMRASAFVIDPKPNGNGVIKKRARNGHDTDEAAMIPNPIRVAVVDNHAMFRDGVVRTLKPVDVLIL